MSSEIERDFERFKRELPSDFSDHVRETYGIDLTARYLGETVPHPIGKGSGQLSLNENQLAEDARAGLAFVVLKTLIAQDEAGSQSMAAWAIHETKMKVERRGGAGGGPGVGPLVGGIPRAGAGGTRSHAGGKPPGGALGEVSPPPAGGPVS